jgi:putative tryptophan/tyrosine transport system substrate-binding protein
MRRREFISLVGGVAVWPLAARAQQPTMPVIGLLNNGSQRAEFLAGFRNGLKEAGYVEGQNLTIEFRYADGRYDQLPVLAADLARRHVRVIGTVGLAATLAARSAATSTPIVFISATDPVKDGLVASIARPGGYLTGVSNLNAQMVQKRLEILREALPDATVIGLLVNPTNPNTEENLIEAQEAARLMGRKLLVVKASAASDFIAAFDILVQQRAGALVIAGDPFFYSKSEQLAELTVHHSIPAIYQLRDFAVAGGLFSYGASLADAFRLMGIYVGRIIKGDKPSELPVQQQTNYDLVINLKTAKALGLNIPLPLIGRANEVIE